MNERIRELRKNLGLTMEKFGERLGVGKTAISGIESGRRNASDQLIRSICREFNVREEWLRNGNGKIYDSSKGKLLAYLEQIAHGNDDFIKDLIEVYMELDQTSRDTLREIASAMTEKYKLREFESPSQKVLDSQTATDEEKMEAYQKYLETRGEERRKIN